MLESLIITKVEYLVIVILLYTLARYISLHHRISLLNLIPVSLLLGLLSSLIINIIPIRIDFEVFSILAFHIFNLSVISLGLTKPNFSKKKNNKNIWGTLWMTGLFTSVLCLQSIIGFASIKLYGFLSNNEVYPGYGFLSGHGFAQGSGHIVAIGKVWENQFGLLETISIGLVFAAIGYILSALIGIPFVKWLLGKRTNKPMEVFPFANRQITRSFTINRNKLKICLVQSLILGIVYILSIAIAIFIKEFILERLLGEHEFFLIISNAIIGMLFIIGLGVAVLFRKFIRKLGLTRLIDGDIQKAQTSSLIDLLIIATFLSIQFSMIISVGLPIVLIILLSVIFTMLLFYFIRLKSKASFLDERLAALFGTVFGSLANGFLLLRILDPKIKSPVFYELALLNFYSVITLTHITLIVFTIGKWERLELVAIIYLGTFFLGLLLTYVSEKRIRE